ncbi:hypothetical protein NDU88_006934 [Pleurodeles waltl]|uniref:Uncharacterized protein n=1 Tax=Pleurodeles waltl TaxID=8319 RepID=A0AAV7QQD9_PLEWA|nr:hypothetical protein NDU88_006934 [Pleurodeles waltl]
MPPTLSAYEQMGTGAQVGVQYGMLPDKVNNTIGLFWRDYDPPPQTYGNYERESEDSITLLLAQYEITNVAKASLLPIFSGIVLTREGRM